MNLLKHKGLSGSAVEIKGDHVLKWTCGHQSAPKLYNSIVLQRSFQGELLPIRPAKIISVKNSDDYVSIEMPYYPDTAFTRFNPVIAEQIGQSLFNRLDGAVVRTGFSSIIAHQVLKCRDSQLKKEFLSGFDSEPDKFPSGFCHGDFGFSNMMVKEDKVFMIDYTPSFIYTPLIDIATMETSLFADFATKKHAELVASLRLKYREWLPQIDILRKVKILSFKNADDHRDLYNGFFL